jgi:transposase
MQGKEASEQQAKMKCSAGVDVSKDKLDAHIWPSGERLQVANTADGIEQLKLWLARFDPGIVVIEATGKWHRELWRCLFQSQFPVAMVDPFKVRMFAKALGVLAKSDPLDASVLARFGYMINPVIRQPPSQVIEELAELVAGRNAAVAEQTGLKNQLSAAKVAVFSEQLRQRIARLSQDINELDKEIAARIVADPELTRRHKILMSIPAIGPVVAATLLTGLAELGTLTDKQIAMLAGLAPIADQSGTHDGKRVIWGGRPSVRRMLYLSAVVAARCNPTLSNFYKRLRAEGKAAKVALIAVARKLVILANTLIAENRTWLKNPPQHA